MLHCLETDLLLLKNTHVQKTQLEARLRPTCSLAVWPTWCVTTCAVSVGYGGADRGRASPPPAMPASCCAEAGCNPESHFAGSGRLSEALLRRALPPSRSLSLLKEPRSAVLMRCSGLLLGGAGAAGSMRSAAQQQARADANDRDVA